MYSSHWQLNQEETPEGREELRNSINREPIYEWEGSQRDSLGAITFVTKVRLQHLPCQVFMHDESLPVYGNLEEHTTTDDTCFQTVGTFHISFKSR